MGKTKSYVSVTKDVLILPAVFLCISLLLSGCLFLPLTRTARVLEKDQSAFQWGMGVGSCGYEDQHTYRDYYYSYSTSYSYKYRVQYPTLFLEYQLGLGGNSDLELFTNLYWWGIGVKWQISKKPLLAVDVNFFLDLYNRNDMNATLIYTKDFRDSALTFSTRLGRISSISGDAYYISGFGPEEFNYLDFSIMPSIKISKKTEILFNLTYRDLLQNKMTRDNGYSYDTYIYDNQFMFSVGILKRFSVKSDSPDETIEKRWEKANKLMEYKLYSEALMELDKITELSPDNEKAYEEMGNCYYNIGMKDKAILYYRRSLSLDPNNKRISEWIEYLNK